MSEQKGPNEVFCQSCGNAIKRRAKICPNCGVENNQNTQSTSSSLKHDPSAYETTVSENWYYGVAASLALWTVGIAIPEGSGIAGFIMLIAWVLMPLSIYYDREWVRATTEWNPDMNPWIVIAAIPGVNLIGGAVYLFRRYNTPKVSSPRGQTTSYGQTTPSGQTTRTSDPLENLRERYSRGELTDEEFEQKVEQIVGTEDRGTARVELNQDNREN